MYLSSPAVRGLPALPQALPAVLLVALLQTLHHHVQGFSQDRDVDIGFRGADDDVDNLIDGGVHDPRRHLNPVRNFIATDSLVDGERERRIHVNGITAKETTIGPDDKHGLKNELMNERMPAELVS
ncbi:hypothetical protein ONE63_004414 [Megalurothrips usitatus]|uniref:Uncharacterized protein n=1 Tax=Megalurothrips usitatus TaxID=439358 RepID=A0AAV7X5V5_9NEOP|nr:hypothetical protein ONE63_004414 [Megalurothrips usitatus]